jgi:hypothetical protein
MNHFLLVHYSFFFSEQAQTRFSFSQSFQAQGTKVEDSLCVELKKVKLEVISKLETPKIFVLCSKKVM